MNNTNLQCDTFKKKWSDQTDFEFGFVPFSDFVMSEHPDRQGPRFESPIEQHFAVRASGCPNFLKLRSPVVSQLNVEVPRFE